MERISLPLGCGSSWTDRQWLWTHAVPGAQPSPSPAVDALGPRAAAAEQPLIVLSTHLSRCGTRQLHPGATDLWLNPNILISPHRASWGAPAITQVQGTCLQSTQEGGNQPKVPDQRQGLLWRTPGLTHPGPVNSPPLVPSLLGHCSPPSCAGMRLSWGCHTTGPSPSMPTTRLIPRDAQRSGKSFICKENIDNLHKLTS